MSTGRTGRPLEGLYREHMPSTEWAALDLLFPLCRDSRRIDEEVGAHIRRMPERGVEVPVIAWADLARAVDDGALATDRSAPDPVRPDDVRMVRLACSLASGTEVDLGREIAGIDRVSTVRLAVAVAVAGGVDPDELTELLTGRLLMRRSR